MRTKDEPLPAGSIGALIARMRRRTRRVGAAIALLAGVLAAVVVFALVACKTTR
jgi:fructose-specific phosphotransferase system IIC component